MQELDALVQERFVAFRNRITEAFSQRHPHIFTILQTVMSGRNFRVGMQVTENGVTAQNYTLFLEGVRITRAESGVLDSEITHPFIGVIKPYLVIERSALEAIMADEEVFMQDIFGVIGKHLPKLTIKFLE